MFELIQIEENYGHLCAITAGGRNCLGNAIPQQHAVGKIGKNIVFGQMLHLIHDRPRHAHVMENDHCSGYRTGPVVNRSSGIFYGRFRPIASNENMSATVLFFAIADSMGFGAGFRVMPSIILNTSASGLPDAASLDQPVIFSATTLR